MAATNNPNRTGAGTPTPAPIPLHPFFTIPDLGADGDFESMGISEKPAISPLSFASFPPPNPLGSNGDSDQFFHNWYVDGFIGGDGGDQSQHDSDNGLGGDHQGMTSDGSDRSGSYNIDSDGGRGGDHQGTTSDGSDRSGDYMVDSDHGGGGDHRGFISDGGDSSGTDTDTGVGNDHNYYDYGDVSDSNKGGGKDQHMSNSDGWDNSGDFDQGAGRDHQGTNSDGSDRSGDGDYLTPSHTDLLRGSDGGDSQQSQGDTDNGAGRDHQGRNWDGGNDMSGDGDESPWGFGTLDRGGLAYDGGDQTKDSDTTGSDNAIADGLDRTVFPYLDGDQNSGSGNDANYNDGDDHSKADSDELKDVHSDAWGYGWVDGKDSPSNRKQTNPCQSGCDDLSMLQFIPATGIAAISGMEIARALIAASIGIAGLPFGGATEAEALVLEAIDVLGTLLEKAGLPEPLRTIVETALNAVGVPSGPLDILGFADRAASVLDPAIAKILQQNGMDAFNALIKKLGGCICPECLNNYRKYFPNTPVKTCRVSAK